MREPDGLGVRAEGGSVLIRAVINRNSAFVPQAALKRHKHSLEILIDSPADLEDIEGVDDTFEKKLSCDRGFSVDAHPESLADNLIKLT